MQMSGVKLLVWIKRDRLMGLIKVKHFYDTILIHIQKDKADSIELTNIAIEFIKRNEKN